MSLYVQYGCGMSAPEGWKNFDISPTLRLQKIPLFGKLIRKVDFPKNIFYGDIVKGLPGILLESCDGVYCSHVLEHLSLEDFRKALRTSLSILKKGGIFRCVVPDLERSIDTYITERAEGKPEASFKLINDTMLGLHTRPKGFKQIVISIAGNSHHLWMWDKYSLEKELQDAGFKHIRLCRFNDSSDLNFKKVEDEARFYGAVAFEALK